MVGVHLRYNLKVHIDSSIFYVEIIIQVKKKKNKKPVGKKVNIMNILLQDISDRSPVVQNSGKNLVSDGNVARMSDYLKGDKKDEA